MPDSFIVFGFLICIMLISQLLCCLPMKHLASSPSIFQFFKLRFSFLTLVFNPRFFYTQISAKVNCTDNFTLYAAGARDLARVLLHRFIVRIFAVENTLRQISAHFIAQKVGTSCC